MSEPIQVDPAVLWTQSQKLLDHMDASRRDHNQHTDDIGNCAEQWSGETKAALSQLSQQWADKRAALHDRIGKSATNIATGSQAFTEQETANQSRLTTMSEGRS